jgi:hypothetical protein
LCGSSPPSVNMAPFIGSKGGACASSSDCINSGGSPVSARRPPCNAALNEFTHPWRQNNSAPYEATTVCGEYNRLLNPGKVLKLLLQGISICMCSNNWPFFNWRVSSDRNQS